MTSKQVREALKLFKQSVSEPRYCSELILQSIDGYGCKHAHHQQSCDHRLIILTGIASPDLIDYLASVIKDGIEVGATAEDILDHTMHQVHILLDATLNQTLIKAGGETWHEWLTLLSDQTGPLPYPLISWMALGSILHRVLTFDLDPKATAMLWIHLAVGVRFRKAITSTVCMDRARRLLGVNRVVFHLDEANNIPVPQWIQDLVARLYEGQHKVHIVRSSNALDSSGGAYVSPSGNLGVYSDYV
ncbi:hypothetical protein CLAFUW4_04110 [Fulvia fulva]|uniref:Uncharacterized protein n=1 Tax=Passalora fulva TaxID=5499 RepID=A0A9Q8P831_PASFU|nr:uncharacterized protein CLAFUR5_04072 [Fulvia fulva]KAK4627348.1 hypothetical protein CLAFUR4_04096 [Fulvia fulva]KAK4627810.1 hypothetical protein CLAFUR0_04097 [Fulvia fulva]UJO16724.1 hypothetical protein CLAFUR5_04072 [Fulvia fulva]WPV13986.1 hypothetical protein CLAFUW4_04110 [Fulvia fulva]WPV28771.1 hypothetical protein CLAFUW7_04099 [Fulvia fulva]